MLPSLGFFRSIPCPYYVSGLCDRPHCCFRHAVSDVRLATADQVQDDDMGVPDQIVSGNEGESVIAESPVRPSVSSSSIGGPSGSYSWSNQTKEVAGRAENTEHLIQDGSSNLQAYNQDSLFEDAEASLNKEQSNELVQVSMAAGMHQDNLVIQNSINLKNEKTDSSNGELLQPSATESEGSTVASQNGLNGVPCKTDDKKKKPHTISNEKEHRETNNSSRNKKRGIETSSNKDEKANHGSHRHHKTENKQSSGHTSSKASDPSNRKSHKSSEGKASTSSRKHHKSKDVKTHGSTTGHKHHSSSSSQKTGTSSSKSSQPSSGTHKLKEKTKSSSSHSSHSTHHKSRSHSHKSSSGRCSTKTSVENSFKSKHGGDTCNKVTFEHLTGTDDGLELAKASYVPDDDQLSVDSDIAEEFLLPEDQDCDEDPSELALECLRMFTGYEPPPSNPTSSKQEVTNNDPLHESQKEKTHVPAPEAVIGKKRVAHAGANPSQSRHNQGPSAAKPLKPKRLTLAETVARRYEQSQAAEMKQVIVTDKVVSNGVIHPLKNVTSTDGKKRISHVPNVAGLMKPALKAPATSSVQVINSATKVKPEFGTTAHTVGKGQNRVAHRPPVSVPGLPRPVLSSQSVAFNSKIPTVCRQKMLDLLVDACLECYDSVEEAYKQALDAEKSSFLKCSFKGVYQCKVLNAVSTLRKEAKEKQALQTQKDAKPGTAPFSPPQHTSHENILAGPSGARHSWSIETKKRSAQVVGTQLYQAFLTYLMTDEQLKNNGYPQCHPSGERGHVIAVKTKEYSYGSKPTGDINGRICDRCLKSYKIRKDGFPLVSESCLYHHGRRFKKRVKGQFESRYSCCDGDDPNIGCTVGASHVSGSPADELRGFVSALQEPGAPEVMGTSPWDIVGIDCEMVYTTYGTELARVTFVGSDLEVLYDELVNPNHPVLDYNTRFSGITEDQMKNVKTTLNDVQAVMLTRFKKNTILVGHSLESDLVALKLVHQFVVDTSVLMPHKMGPPYKRALRNLSSECLGKIIQAGEHGHDSAEDARTALEIVLWKVKEDSKVQDAKKRKVSVS